MVTTGSGAVDPFTFGDFIVSPWGILLAVGVLFAYLLR
jgi:hypothetical protein